MSAAQASNIKIIYVPLLNEGTPVVRPTQGVPMGDRVYRLLETPDYDPEVENWEFPPGSVVQCVFEVRDGERILVARTLVSAN